MSYRLKLTITISLLIALSFGIGGTLMMTTSFHETLEQETQTALSAFETIQNTLYLFHSLGSQTDLGGLSGNLSQMEGTGHWQALCLSSGEEIFFQSGETGMLAYTLPIPTSDLCSYLSVSDAYGHGLVIANRMRAGETEMVLMARFDVSHAYAMRRTQLGQYVLVYLAVVGFGIGASMVLSFALTRHLRRLTGTVRRISDGDLSKRSRIASNDEFGQLSRDFDAMADRLQETISRLETDMQRQEQFMGAFAHELKTPMTSIIGFADLLRQGNLDENTRMMAADYIYSEGHRLERLSFKLLDLLLLKKDEVTMKRVLLSTYMHEVEQALAPAMKNKDVRLICRAEQKRVVLEPDLVKSLLYNLVDNAAKAMDNGGIIAVHGMAIPGGCQLQVVDNGRGMEPGELTKITEAFYRVDKARSRSQGGAGLGLALCKQIVQLHDGTIQFASEPGKGTRVTVSLYGKVGSKNE